MVTGCCVYGCQLYYFSDIWNPICMDATAMGRFRMVAKLYSLICWHVSYLCLIFADRTCVLPHGTSHPITESTFTAVCSRVAHLHNALTPAARVVIPTCYPYHVLAHSLAPSLPPCPPPHPQRRHCLSAPQREAPPVHGSASPGVTWPPRPRSPNPPQPAHPPPFPHDTRRLTYRPFPPHHHPAGATRGPPRAETSPATRAAAGSGAR